MTVKNSILVLLLSFLLISCGSDESANKSTDASDTFNSEKQPSTTLSNSQKTVDISFRSWQQIKDSGYIRALKLGWEEQTSLPRSGTTSLYHIELIKRFASLNQLEIKWIKVDNLVQMFTALQEFKADIIPRHLTITDERKKQMLFTRPLSLDKEILIAKAGTTIPADQKKLEVTVPKNTAYIQSIKSHYPDWKINTIDASLNSEEIADSLAEGKILFSVLDGQSVKTLLSYRKDISQLLDFPTVQKLAWAVSLNNQSFSDKLNEYIAAEHIAQSATVERTFDLDSIKEKKRPLRIITRNSPETYFLWRGQLMGFEYELMKEFGKQNGVRIEMVVAESYQQMTEFLQQGKGDVIAAGISRTDSRKDQLLFSYRYNRVAEMLVANKQSPLIDKLEDLKGRTISVRKTSAFWAMATELATNYGAKVEAANETLPTELLIAQVANGDIDLTIADSNLISIELRFRDNLMTPLTLKKSVPYAYAVRKNNPKLLSAINRFVKKEYRGTFYNVVKTKYFGNQKKLEKYREFRIQANSALSPYDNLVQENSRKYQFDWRLITSQMFQESRFNPTAKSSAGAKGLMQVLPSTAKELGYENLNDPNQAIAAGIQYLNWTRDRFLKDIPLEERTYFALASYNAGYGHVKDAQRLAKTMGLNPNKWFNNVEKAMLLLQKPEYYKKSRFGYVRGTEPVNYVRDINQRYLSYVNIAG